MLKLVIGTWEFIILVCFYIYLTRFLREILLGYSWIKEEIVEIAKYFS